MRTSSRRAATAVAGLSAAVLAGALLAPADAASTEVTFTVGGSGGLAITAAASETLSVAGSLASGSLGQVEVDDTRNTLVNVWTASVSITDFTTGGGSAAETISKVGATYTVPTSPVDVGTPMLDGNVTGLLEGVGGALIYGGTGALTIAGSTPVAQGAYIGPNTVSWNPTLSVLIPPTAPAGTYAGTVTHSVS